MNPDQTFSVVAFVQPFLLKDVIDALRRVPEFPGMSVTEVRGFGSRCAHAPRRGEQTEVEPFERRVRIEVFCHSAVLEPVLDRLVVTARTGNPGDGKVFVSAVDRAIRIRTGTEGPEALLCEHASGSPGV